MKQQKGEFICLLTTFLYGGFLALNSLWNSFEVCPHKIHCLVDIYWNLQTRFEIYNWGHLALLRNIFSLYKYTDIVWHVTNAWPRHTSHSMSHSPFLFVLTKMFTHWLTTTSWFLMRTLYFSCTPNNMIKRSINAPHQFGTCHFQRQSCSWSWD